MKKKKVLKLNGEFYAEMMTKRHTNKESRKKRKTESLAVLKCDLFRNTL